MPRILFISTESADLVREAAIVTRSVADSAWQIWAAAPGLSDIADIRFPAASLPDWIKVLPLETVNTTLFDLVVQMNRTPMPEDTVFAGFPLRICWKPDELTPNRSRDRQTVEPLHERLKARALNLFKQEFLEAGLRIRLTFGSLLNHLTDGVMAHDKNRRIFLFNRPAELITGYQAEDVIGRDCHEVFSDRFCGGDCSFCQGVSSQRTRVRYPTRFVKRAGEVRELEMSVVTLDAPDRDVLGALVIFRDATELNVLRRKAHAEAGFHGMVGTHPSMLRVYEAIEELTSVNVPILIQGESGTGKEMIAKALHELGPRSRKPFVPVNCSALPEGTLESELFGHVRGAFTGAFRDKKGRFELADGGILFLDEIGEISANLQVKLLRVLQENRFVPVGGETMRTVDVQVICATNRDLKKMTINGQFREDLYYRLAVVPVHLPPLRDRVSDIPALVDHYLEQVSKQMGAAAMEVSSRAMELLMQYRWPGNVRELRNSVQYGIIKSHSGVVEPEHLPPEIRDAVARPTDPRPPGRPVKLREMDVLPALTLAGGNKAKAARALGVSRTTLYKILRHTDTDL